ncbi:MAG: GNAT family protein [Ignavibacteria bacterium]|nr:GNAT family N-acetyltransferase [Ignavibacteria bacterium]MBK7157819.1 GNAT family N-acetyltransferase [Ignavibacteria bacterium]MBK7445656.1 GNAT family N-acetyltransferase [Ignavibacteria bacterium]MBK9404217.1 GNAT family N-acetyltransferase [Ignavibacteria bacterium]MBL0109185.1 GNAT family N-acetyltransferase [Ignavibacteria bacterium]
MIRFENIGFRSVERDDIEIIRKEHNDESVLLMLRDPRIITELQQIQWWESISKNRNNTVYCIFHETPENVIGVWKLQDLDDTNRCTEMGMDIFKNYRGKGFGLKSFKMIFKYIFENLNVHTIYAKVGAYNETSLIAAQKAGYKISGKIPESLFRKGMYWDNILLSITFDEYKNNSEPK